MVRGRAVEGKARGRGGGVGEGGEFLQDLSFLILGFKARSRAYPEVSAREESPVHCSACQTDTTFVQHVWLMPDRVGWIQEGPMAQARCICLDI